MVGVYKSRDVSTIVNQCSNSVELSSSSYLPPHLSNIRRKAQRHDSVEIIPSSFIYFDYIQDHRARKTPPIKFVFQHQEHSLFTTRMPGHDDLLVIHPYIRIFATPTWTRLTKHHTAVVVRSQVQHQVVCTASAFCKFMQLSVTVTLPASPEPKMNRSGQLARSKLEF